MNAVATLFFLVFLVLTTFLTLAQDDDFDDLVFETVIFNQTLQKLNPVARFALSDPPELVCSPPEVCKTWPVHELENLVAPAVGRLLLVLTESSGETTVVPASTAFVGPCVVATALHPFLKTGYRATQIWFTNATFVYPLDLDKLVSIHAVSQAELLSTSPLSNFKLRDEKLRLVQHLYFKTADPSGKQTWDYDPLSDTVWHLSGDFAFVRILNQSFCPSSYLLPSATIPPLNTEILCSGYAIPDPHFSLHYRHFPTLDPLKPELLYSFFHGYNRKVVSYGVVLHDSVRPPSLLPHSASVTTGFSGSLCVQLSNPSLFVGVHIGQILDTTHNLLLSVHHRAFVFEYAKFVLPLFHGNLPSPLWSYLSQHLPWLEGEDILSQETLQRLHDPRATPF